MGGSPNAPTELGQWMGLDSIDADDAWTDCDDWACNGNFSNLGAVDHLAQWTFELGMGGPIDDYLLGTLPGVFEPAENHWGGSIGGTVFGGTTFGTVAQGYPLTGQGPWTVDDSTMLTADEAWQPAGPGGQLSTGYYRVRSPWFWQLL